MVNIMDTCPCNLQRFFSAVKIENFFRKNLVFSIYLLKNRLWVHVRTAYARRL